MTSKKEKLIIAPGWATPSRYYRAYLEEDAEVVNFGFFESPSETIDFTSILEEAMPEAPVRMIGHSLGAAASLALASQNSSVAKLVLFAPFARFASAPDCPGQAPAGIRAMLRQLKQDPEGLLENFYNAALSPAKFDVDVPKNLNPERLAQGLRWLMNFDIRDRLNDIEAEVLIIHGEKDGIVSMESVEYLLSRLPKADLRVIEDGGHATIFTRVNQCLQMVREFFDD